METTASSAAWRWRRRCAGLGCRPSPRPQTKPSRPAGLGGGGDRRRWESCRRRAGDGKSEVVARQGWHATTHDTCHRQQHERPHHAGDRGRERKTLVNKCSSGRLKQTATTGARHHSTAPRRPQGLTSPERDTRRDRALRNVLYRRGSTAEETPRRPASRNAPGGRAPPASWQQRHVGTPVPAALSRSQGAAHGRTGHAQEREWRCGSGRCRRTAGRHASAAMVQRKQQEGKRPNQDARPATLRTCVRRTSVHDCTCWGGRRLGPHLTA